VPVPRQAAPLMRHALDMKARETFEFLSPGRLVDGDLELVLVKRTPADPIKGYVPGYEFEMRPPNASVRMGTIRLRIGPAAKLRLPGHIGYEVNKPFRGHRFAARSCGLLLPLARRHGLSAVWLTVDPKNTPSRRTCEIIGTRYVETVRIPTTHEMYAQGARYRRRYRLDVKQGLSNQALNRTSDSHRGRRLSASG
jgi:predicted acetyltransferase